MSICRVCKKNINIVDKYNDYCEETCLDDYCYLYDDDYLINKYKKDPLVFELLINTAMSCINSSKRDLIYKPKPANLSFLEISQFSNIAKNLFENFHYYFSSLKKDNDIVNEYGLNFYYFLKFTIITNNTNLISSNFQKTKNIFLQENPKSIKESNIQFDISYSPEIEKDFKNIDRYYLFHGSTSSNWYGMLRNGIKNYSGTSLMANGAVYGSGVYLSDSLVFAKNYSTKFGSNGDGGVMIVGVCQVKNLIETYKKAPNIYTVINDKELLLRHIIIFNNYSNIKEIEDYYLKELPKEFSFSNKNIFKINNKRLVKEVEYMEKLRKKLSNYDISDFNIDSKIDPYLQININLKFKDDNNIFKINFIFRDFPLMPPVVYLENFKIKNDKYMNGNIFVIPELLPKNWNIKTKLSSILEKIFNDINNELINNNVKYEKNILENIIFSYDNYINKNKLYLN
jgi:hypothetical protein